VYVGSGFSTFAGATISRNIASSNGGGVYVNDGLSIFNDATISKNVAGSYGGGLYLSSGTSSLTNVTISENTTTTYYGGGVYIGSGSPNFNSVIISGNTAKSYGGGVYTTGTSTSPAFTNTLISGNTSTSYGGGVYVNSGKPVFTGATIAGNYAKTSGGGGGIYASSGTTTLRNSIVGNNNTPGTGKNVAGTSASYSATYSLVQGGGAAGTNIIDNDPLFVLPDMAGDGTPAPGGDYHLQPVSPAVDAGSRSLIIGTTDLDGKPREHGCNVDMGAYESSYGDFLGGSASGVVYVSAYGKGNEDGSSWENAYPGLADPLYFAQSQQGCGNSIKEIWVSEGIYTPAYPPASSADSRDATFAMTAGVKLYGGFPADATDATDMSARSWRRYPTVLSGDLKGDDIPGNPSTKKTDNAYHVVLAVGSMISDDADTACLDGFVVTGGHADGSGTITVKSQGVNRTYGGGIYTTGTAMRFANDSVAGNHSTGTSSNTGGGGGIYASTDMSTYANVAVSRNTSGAHGGGVYLNSGNPAFTNALVSENTATGSSGNGGGVYVAAGNPAFTNALVSGNITSIFGGGAFVAAGAPVFTNATVAGNYAGSNGGGIYKNSSTVNLRNSIVGGNNTPGIDKNIGGGSYSVTYSLVQGGGVTGEGVIAGDPLFIAPDTAKAGAPALGGNYRLQRFSPAINVGNSELNGTATDLDGKPRVHGYDMDMGAYESSYKDSLGNASGIVYVSVDGKGSKDGSSWENAYPGLAYPLYFAQLSSGGSNIKEIWVAKGTYTPAYAPIVSLNARDVTFMMKTGLKLYGGFPDDADDGVGMESRDWRRYPTVLSGDVNGDDSPGNSSRNKTDNAYHVVMVAAGSMVRNRDTACLDGFMVTGGYADGSGAITVGGQSVDRTCGGGIYSAGTAMRFANDSIVGSSSSSSNGGGVYVIGGALSFANTYVGGNTAGSGGGVYLTDGSLSFTNVHISDNAASGSGGGVCLNGSGFSTFTNVTISKNNATSSGSGMYITDGIATFTDATISKNVAGANGGGMYLSGGISYFTNVDISENAANGTYGGGAYLGGGTSSFTGVRVSGNTVGSNGGGVYATGSGSLEFFNALISGNTAGGNGGGVYVSSGDPVFTGATIAGNYAKNNGGGVYRNGGRVTLYNSIVGNNNAGSSKNIYGTSSYYSASYSLLQDGGATGTDNITGDPLFVAPSIAGEGAPTLGGDYHLQPISPAIDAGSSDLNSTEKDLDGRPRVHGDEVDMGAYESAYRDSIVSTNGIVYVSVDGKGIKDGSSWDNAFPGLAYPLYIAQLPSGGAGSSKIKEIWVSKGTYTPEHAPVVSADSRDAAFTMRAGVKLYGGFPANATDGTDMASRDWRANPTVLSGDLNNNDIPGDPSTNNDNAYHVVIAAGSMIKSTDTACLDGFVITGGYAGGSGSGGAITVNSQSVDRTYGGGIYSAGTAMRFANDSIVGNYSSYGGGICAATDMSTYANIAVCGNTSGTCGGGVYVNIGNPAFTNALISGNIASGASFGGGGVYVAAGNPVFTNALISGNSAVTFGGGVFIGDGAPVFTNATVAGNYAGINGGGMYRYGGTVNLRNSIVGSNNTSGNNKNTYGSSYSATNSLVHGGGIAGVVNRVPLFVAPDTAKNGAPVTGGDYRLQLLSPAIDAGSNSLNTTSKDLAGNPRTVAGKIDMGAYEFQPIELHITGAAIAKKIYDGADAVEVNNVTLGYSDEAVAGKLTFGVEYTAVGKIVPSLPGESPAEAGTGKTVVVTVRILPALLPPERYTFSDTTFTLSNVEVERRPITVAADPQTKTYGETDPKLTWRLTSGSLVGGDTLAGSLKHNGVTAGRYPIIQNTPLYNPNYLVIYVEDSITITPALLTVTPNGGQHKVYGEADPNFAFAVSGWKYSDKNDSTRIITGALSRVAGKTPGFYAIKQGSLSAGGGGSYAISFVENVLFEITIKELIPKIPTLDTSKVYDGSTVAGISGNAGFDGLVPNDNVSFDVAAEYDSKEAGENKNISVTYTLTGPDKGSYSIPSPIAVLSVGIITPKPLTVSGTVVRKEKSYDGSDSAYVISAGTLDSVISGDLVALSATAKYDSKSAGEGKTITFTYALTGADKDNYYVKPADFAPEDGKITGRKLEVSGTKVDTVKVYDGSDSARVTLVGELGNVLANDTVMVSATAVYKDGKAAGESKTITVAYAISGKDAGCYVAPDTLTFTNLGKITPRPLTVSGTVVQKEKLHDGSDSAHVASAGTLHGVLSGDDVKLSATAKYDSSSAGVGKTIAVAYKLGGLAAGNYVAPKDTTLSDGKIAVAQLKISGTLVAREKVYDGSDSACVTSAGSLDGVAPGDDVGFLAVAKYDDKLVGEGKTITVAYSLVGKHIDTYIAPIDTTYSDGKITPRPLTVSGTEVDTVKVYDGSDSAHITSVGTLVGVIGNDSVALSATATYDSKSAGERKHITVTYTLIGRDAGSYAKPDSTEYADGEITPKPLTVSGTKVDTVKVYDGSDSAHITSTGTLVGVIGNDSVALSATATYDSKSAGEHKHITVTYTLIGRDAGSYAKPDSTEYADGEITPKPLTVSGTEVDTVKVYDGSDSACVTSAGTLNGVVSGDDVTLAITAKYDNSSVGAGKTITVTYSLGGADIGNYVAPEGDTLNDGKIANSRLTVSGTLVATEKVYDGSDSACVASIGDLHGVMNGEEVILFATAKYNDSAAGDGKTVTVVYSLGGLHAGSYIAPIDTTYADSKITPRTLTVLGTVVQKEKVHDGSDSAHVASAGTLHGVVGGDDVTLYATAKYDSSSVGVGKMIAVAYRLGGLSAGNYAAPEGDTLSDGKIAVAWLTASGTLVATEKVYDGSDSACVTSIGDLYGVVNNDNVTLSAVAKYDDKAIGEGKTVTVAYSLTGAHADSYIAPTDATYTNGKITPKPLTVSGTVVQKEKVYDGSDSAHVAAVGTLNGVVGGDDVTLAATAKYDSSSIGVGKMIAVAYSLGGADIGNYVAPEADTLNDGKIALARLTVSGMMVATEKVYDGSDSVCVTSAGNLDGVAAGDDVGFLAVAKYDDKSAGESKTITVAYSLVGDQAGSYIAPIDTAYSDGKITTRPLTVSGTVVQKEKLHDGSDSAHVASAGTLHGLVGGDDVKLSVAAKYSSSSAGAGKAIAVAYSLGGVDAGNYAAPKDTTLSDGKIALARLTVSGTLVATEKVYDGSDSARVTSAGDLYGVMNGEDVMLSATAKFDDKSVGEGKTLTVAYSLTGLHAGSYIAPIDTTYADGKIAPKPLTVSGTVVQKEKVHDGSDSAHVVSAGTLNGVVGGDDVKLSATARYDSSSIGVGKMIAVFYSLGGADTGNYLAPESDTLNDGKIANFRLTVSGTLVAMEKVYDGSDSASVISAGDLHGVVTGDNVGFLAVAKYDDKSVGESKTITVTYSLVGAHAGSYIAPIDTTYSDGKITPKPLTVSGTVVQKEKVSDGSDSAHVASAGTLGGVLSGDDVTLYATAKYDSSSVGVGKTIAVAYSLGGAEAGNYAAPESDTLSDGKIALARLTVSGTVVATEKGYDGSDSARVTSIGDFYGVVNNDNVTLSAVAKYDDKSVGEGKTLTVAYSLAGAHADSYIAPIDATYSDGKITAKSLTVSGTVVQKEKGYDGSDSAHVASAGTLGGVVGGDDVTLAATAKYNNSLAGVGKTIAVAYSLGGADIGNYVAPEGDMVRGGVILPPDHNPDDSTFCKCSEGYDGDDDGDGIPNINDPDSPCYYLPGSGGDTSYCGENVLNIFCPEYPWNVDDGKDVPVDTLVCTYGDPSFKLSVPAGEEVGWSSLNPSVATVDPLDGTVEVASAGITYLLRLATSGVQRGAVLRIKLLNVLRKPLDAVDTWVDTVKVFDGTRNADAAAGSLVGVEPQDAGLVWVEVAARYSDGAAGQGKPITVTYKLSGSRSFCYVAPPSYAARGSIIDDGDANGDRVFDALGAVLRQIGESRPVPCAGVSVKYTVSNAWGKQDGEQKTNSAGRYIISGLGKGDTVRVKAPIMRSYITPPDPKMVVVNKSVVEISELLYRSDSISMITLWLIDEAGNRLATWEREEIGDTIYYEVPCSRIDNDMTLNVRYVVPLGVSDSLVDAHAVGNGGDGDEFVTRAGDLYPYHLKVDMSLRGRRSMFTVKLYSAVTGEVKRYTIMLERKFELFDVIKEHIGNLRVVHNNPDINGHGLKFSACGWWYKRDAGEWLMSGVSSLYYIAGPSVRDKFSPRDSMRVVLYSEAGNVFATCPGAGFAEYGGSGEAGGSSKNAAGVSVYPNPVAAGGLIRLKQEALLDGDDELYTRLYLLDAQGRPVLTADLSALRSGLIMPELPGVYHLVLEGKAGKKVVKIAVGQRGN
jgi:predicted alpha/beta-fold hydrolase